jgi:hypothetical protein
MPRIFPTLLLTGLLAGLAGAAEPGVLPGAEGSPGVVTEDADPAPPAEPRWQVAADYLFWWLREGRLPPTLTTSRPASRGLLGQADTHILYGDDRLETRHGDQFNGVRVTLAYWLDDARTLGVEADAFFLERDSTYFKAISDGSQLLARPYYLPDGSPASYIIAGPAPTGPRSGAFVGYSRVELFGEEANLIAALLYDDVFHLDAIAGARFLQLRDRADLTAASHSLPDQATLFGLEDHYRTHNAYYGAQVGLRGDVCAGPWMVGLRGTVGLGGNDEEVTTFGRTIIQTSTSRVVTPTGLTVQQSNSGTFERASLNMVSEAGVQVGYQATQRVRFFAGYTFLLWDAPVRAGDQIDLVVNRNAGTAPARPSIPFREDVFWAQGVNAGITFAW